MLFNTKDNVSLWLRITAVALSIAIVVTGGLAIVWELTLGRLHYDTPYETTEGVNVDVAPPIVHKPFEGDPDEGAVDDEFENSTTDEGGDTSSDSIQPTELKDLKSNIRGWMNTGSPIRDKDVINILFIGMENNTENGTIQPLSVNGRADAMCIASVNKKTNTVTLASLLRDQYSYVKLDDGGRYTKFHHALRYAGPQKQIEMIERYYKVVIDNYVIVNFESLPKIIDAVGGITISVTEEESKYLKNTCKWKINVGAQDIAVDGGHALTYMRIRKGQTGGDEARTGRQQKVMMLLAEKVKNYSRDEMISFVNEILPYLRTGLTPNDILAYAVTALTEGWLNYDIKQVTLPDSECCKPFNNPADGGAYWKVDYPVAAYKLQMALFGKSNIVLEDHKSWI